MRVPAHQLRHICGQVRVPRDIDLRLPSNPAPLILVGPISRHMPQSQPKRPVFRNCHSGFVFDLQRTPSLRIVQLIPPTSQHRPSPRLPLPTLQLRMNECNASKRQQQRTRHVLRTKEVDEPLRSGDRAPFPRGGGCAHRQPITKTHAKRVTANCIGAGMPHGWPANHPTYPRTADVESKANPNSRSIFPTSNNVGSQASPLTTTLPEPHASTTKPATSSQVV